MKVVWTQNAIKHLTNIYDYIAKDSARYATRVVDRITARSQRIGRFPESGQMLIEYGDPQIREVIETPYRVIYRLQVDRIEVLAVIHGARELPPSLE